MSQNKEKHDEFIAGNNIPGSPGFRTRANRSGLDYIDTRTEGAYMEGLFYRKLYTLRLRTRNPFYLILMFVFGVIPLSISLVLTFLTFNEGRSWLILIFPSLVTIPLTLNFTLSILEIVHIIPSSTSQRPVHQEKDDEKKKFPKHRKDYK